MMGPKRTGFIYVRQGLVDALRPQTVGGGSSVRYDAAKGEFVLQADGRSASSPGRRTTRCSTPWAPPSTSWRRSAIDLHLPAAAARWPRRFYRGLAGDPRRRAPLARGGGLPDAAMIGFRMKTRTSAEIMAHLAKDKIRARPVGEGGLGSIRISFYLNNRDEDVTAILDSLSSSAG
ncbi:MAG: hypothetical protein M0C28_44970 [Candidatus Moduliflexus flocculans]|nr:hypothetical protein [Candidatus Moduliflexus flocculans]